MEKTKEKELWEKSHSSHKRTWSYSRNESGWGINRFTFPHITLFSVENATLSLWHSFWHSSFTERNLDPQCTSCFHRSWTLSWVATAKVEFSLLTGWNFMNSSPPHNHVTSVFSEEPATQLENHNCAYWMSHKAMNKSESLITFSILRGVSRHHLCTCYPLLCKLKCASIANAKRPAGFWMATLFHRWLAKKKKKKHTSAVGFSCDDIIWVVFFSFF